MLEAAGGTAIYGILGVIVLAIASVFGLVFFVNKEEKFEDVVAAQKKEQEALLNSLQGSNKSSKGNKKWSKLKSKKSKKGTENDENEPEIDSGVDDEEPSSDSVVVPPKEAKKSSMQKEPKKDDKTQQSTKDKLDGKEETVKKDDKSTKDKSKKSKKPKQIAEEEIAIAREKTVMSAPEDVIVPAKEQELKTTPSPSQLSSGSDHSSSKKGKLTSGKPKQTKTVHHKSEQGRLLLLLAISISLIINFHSIVSYYLW